MLKLLIRKCLMEMLSSFRTLLWGDFIQRLDLLISNSAALRNSKNITPVTLRQLTSNNCRPSSQNSKTVSKQEFHAVMSSGTLMSTVSQCHVASQSALWLPIDLFLEDSMDGSNVPATSAVENLAGIIFLFYLDA